MTLSDSVLYLGLNNALVIKLIITQVKQNSAQVSLFTVSLVNKTGNATEVKKSAVFSMGSLQICRQQMSHTV